MNSQRGVRTSNLSNGLKKGMGNSIARNIQANFFNKNIPKAGKPPPYGQRKQDDSQLSSSVID